MPTPSDITLDWQQLPSLENRAQPAVLDNKTQNKVEGWLETAMVTKSAINKLLKIPRIIAVICDLRRLDPFLSAIDLANEKLLCTHSHASEKINKDLSKILAERGFPTADIHATIVSLQMYEDEMEKGEPVGYVRKKVRGAIRWIFAGRDFLTEKGGLRDRFNAAKSSHDFEKADLYAEERDYHINVAMKSDNTHLYEHYLEFKRDAYLLEKGGQYERVFRTMSDIRRLLREYNVHDVDLFALMHYLHEEHEKYIRDTEAPDTEGVTGFVSKVKKGVSRILDVDVGDLWGEVKKRREAKHTK